MKAFSYFGLLSVALLLGACAPSPEEVCQKTFDLAKGEVGEPLANKAIGGDMAACVKSEGHRREMQGMLKYKKNNACVMDAKDWKTAKACSSS